MDVSGKSEASFVHFAIQVLDKSSFNVLFNYASYTNWMESKLKLTFMSSNACISIVQRNWGI